MSFHDEVEMADAAFEIYVRRLEQTGLDARLWVIEERYAS